ncbi:hypothetical protein FKG94_07320 [Exilibacterium tricleocarpae]|uniref:Multidrug transporter n=1 Tax=Exilibacterium tricleocarpae TaxID=2591008 RepID=A0A545TZ98_9GAMM|nr:hypothetical protein [Exilibacterium tricleocarpae]TQV82535.1 hypothetical protein FKG94_07320 [Exilibacterium tricleocarpae]
MTTQKLWARIVVLVCALSLANLGFAAEERYNNGVDEDPSALAMATDLVIVRPVMLGITVVGSALWLVSLPFSAAGGNVKQAADTLVIGPGKTTFVRCLGCTRSGYKK